MKKTILFLVLIISGQIFSQDIIGGHIRTKLVSGFSYSISITLFTDASKNINRPTIPISFGDSNSGTLSLTGTSNLNGTNLKTYSGTHTYSGSGQYIVSSLDTFQILGIKNMLNSQTQQFYMETLINIDPSLGINSSPSVSFYPLNLSVAINQLLQDNCGFSDIDGDSLSYTLLNRSGNGYYIPLNSVISNSTGLFSFTKDTVGKYAFSIKISEWRKNSSNLYVILGYSQMDFVVEITNPVGLNDMVINKINLCLFPNPVSDELNFSYYNESGKIYSVEILNELGQIVLKTNSVNKITVADLPKGFYFLRLSDKNISTDCIKFIKE
jgi:hypothetical protein